MKFITENNTSYVIFKVSRITVILTCKYIRYVIELLDASNVHASCVIGKKHSHWLFTFNVNCQLRTLNTKKMF